MGSPCLRLFCPSFRRASFVVIEQAADNIAGGLPSGEVSRTLLSRTKDKGNSTGPSSSGLLRKDQRLLGGIRASYLARIAGVIQDQRFGVR